MTVCVEDRGRAPGTDVPLAANGYATMKVLGGEFPGQYEAYARYLGNQDYWGSTAPYLSSDIFTVTQTPTQLAVTSDNNPSVSGSPVNLTTTLTASDNAAESTKVGPPTGTITYTITDPNSVSYTCQVGNMFVIRAGHVQGAFTCFLPPGDAALRRHSSRHGLYGHGELLRGLRLPSEHGDLHPERRPAAALSRRAGGGVTRPRSR